MSKELIEKIIVVESKLIGIRGFVSSAVLEILSEIEKIKEEVEGLEEKNATYRGLMHHAGIEY